MMLSLGPIGVGTILRPGGMIRVLLLSRTDGHQYFMVGIVGFRETGESTWVRPYKLPEILADQSSHQHNSGTFSSSYCSTKTPMISINDLSGFDSSSPTSSIN